MALCYVNILKNRRIHIKNKNLEVNNIGNFIDLTGMKIGRLYIKEYLGEKKWLCLCDCGNEKIINGNSLRKKDATKSCGCLAKELTVQRSIKHNKSNERIYRTWINMKQRCYNTQSHNYEEYGGRGIEICKEWMDDNNGFINFYSWAVENGYNNTLEIDRINVNGNYEPNNCRWITNLKQQRNKQDTIIINVDGKEIPLLDYLESINRLNDYGMIKTRITKGKMHIDDALSIPRQKKYRTVNYNGNNINIKEYLRLLGRLDEYSRVLNRLNTGLSIEDALTIPKQKNQYTFNKVKENT